MRQEMTSRPVVCADVECSEYTHTSLGRVPNQTAVSFVCRLLYILADDTTNALTRLPFKNRLPMTSAIARQIGPIFRYGGVMALWGRYGPPRQGREGVARALRSRIVSIKSLKESAIW